MVDRETLERRLNALQRWLEKLDRFREMPRESFATQEDAHDLAERYLHLALESSLDIANHLLADHAIPPPDSYSGLFPAMADAGMLDPVLAMRLAQAARLRNLLVHQYLEIDHTRIHQVLCEDLDDLRSFAREVAVRFL